MSKSAIRFQRLNNQAVQVFYKQYHIADIVGGRFHRRTSVESGFRSAKMGEHLSIAQGRACLEALESGMVDWRTALTPRVRRAEGTDNGRGQTIPVRP